VHLDAGYDSGKTRTLLADRDLHDEIADKGEKAPIQASGRWHVERTNAWHNGFNRFQRCYERRERVIERLLRTRRCDHHRPSPHPQAWTTHRWDNPTRTTAMIHMSNRLAS
jgi:hypothetical protein